tara:strand:- start:241 stop:1167 length:927 start_codon:yes stop_codon:yes gene_type:complete
MKHQYRTPDYPVPILSKKNVNFIEKIINEKNIDTIIEYGSGFSTLYFIKNLKNKKIKFISVENTKIWFYDNIKNITKKFNPKNCTLHKYFWNKKDYKKFYETKNEPFTKIVQGKSRIKKIKQLVKLGPFYRFEKDGNSRYSGKLSILLPLIRPMFFFINSLLQKFNKFNNEKSEWKCQIDELEFTYKLISPSVKDQFAESPNRDDYVYSGLEILENDSKNKNVLVMIDGGPRHYIVDQIINKKYNHNIHICLFDAYRPEYEYIFNKYKGTFFKGEEELVDGTNYYSIFSDEKKIPHLARELWYFNYQN